MATKSFSRAAVLVPALSSIFALALHGQEPTPPAPTAAATDSSPSAAVLHGRAAAERRGTGGRFVGGFASGLLLGLIGTGITYAIAGSDDASLPAMEAAKLTTAHPNYSLAYQQGYAERLKAKRKSSALTGGLLGTLTVVVVYVAATSGN